MVSVLSLLIPIALSAVFVFIASSIIHMATPWHKNDLMKLPNEDGVMNALRPFNLPPGNYGFPQPDSMKDMKSPAFHGEDQGRPGGVHDDQRPDGTSTWAARCSSGSSTRWSSRCLPATSPASRSARAPNTCASCRWPAASRSSAMRWRRCTSRSGGAAAGAGPSATCSTAALRPAHRRDLRLALAA